MVSFRGINIHVVTQIGAARLPEYHTAQALDALGSVAVCYIPTYTGAQLWFEYSIDGPHPPGAAYFFKLLINGHFVTSWDCTTKHDYHGKTAYSLHVIKSGLCGERQITQNLFVFSGMDKGKSPNVNENCIEVRVHRINRRRRIRQPQLVTSMPKHLHGETLSAVKLVNGGVIEPDRPIRRYQYLLLDPQDEPYATFRLYCRTKDYLEKHQISHGGWSTSPISTATSNSRYVDIDGPPRSDTEMSKSRSPVRSPCTTTNEVERTMIAQQLQKSPTLQEEFYMPRSPTSPTIKDSIEELPSLVPRSPDVANLAHCRAFDIPLCSPAKKSSPTLPELESLNARSFSHPTTSLPVSTTGSDEWHLSQDLAVSCLTSIPAPKDGKGSLPFRWHKASVSKVTLVPVDAIDRQAARPLSPFTRAGFLRRLTGGGRSASS